MGHAKPLLGKQAQAFPGCFALLWIPQQGHGFFSEAVAVEIGGHAGVVEVGMVPEQFGDTASPFEAEHRFACQHRIDRHIG